MLTALCASKKIGSHPQRYGGAEEVLSATATTWRNDKGGQWQPCSTFVWKMNMGSDGFAITAFSSSDEFPFNDPPASLAHNWLFQGATLIRNSYGRPIQMSSALNVRSAIVYQTSTGLPLASIQNGAFKESAAFTCDYDMDQSAGSEFFFDLESGWEKGDDNATGDPHSVAFAEDSPHFGKKCVKVTNAYGPTCNLKVSKPKDYIFSAWVKVTSGHVKLNVEYREKVGGISGEIETWPILRSQLQSPYHSESETRDATEAADWTYVEVSVPGEHIARDVGYIRAWVGTADGGVAYVDGVRFYPTTALVTTSYYDQKWHKDILSVDANNQPSRRITYDKFGRPVDWHKIARNTSRGTADNLVMHKDYHLMNE